MQITISADAEAFQLASEALADLDLQAFAAEASGDIVASATVVETILAAAIPRIRQDERRRCRRAAQDAVPARWDRSTAPASKPDTPPPKTPSPTPSNHYQSSSPLTATAPDSHR